MTNTGKNAATAEQENFLNSLTELSQFGEPEFNPNDDVKGHQPAETENPTTSSDNGDGFEGIDRNDAKNKPAKYAALGIPEYWRFDETGAFHGTRLAGDRLVQGRYEPIPIEEVEEGICQGHSAALGLLIRWDHGQLHWHDPETGREIPNLEGERARADAAEEAQAQAEARVRELEAELARRDEGE